MSVTIMGYQEDSLGDVLYYMGVRESGEPMIAHPVKKPWLDWTSTDLEWIIVQ